MAQLKLQIGIALGHLGRTIARQDGQRELKGVWSEAQLPVLHTTAWVGDCNPIEHLHVDIENQ